MKRIITLLTIVMLTTAAWSEKTAQAIWTEGNKTLTFTYAEPVSVGSTYGGQTVTNVWSGTAVTATGTSAPGPGWVNTVAGTMTTVKFDSSFKNVKPTSCYRWFYYCGKLTTITGISNLTTTNVTDMRQMFYRCSSLTSLNLSSFNTAKVTVMNLMFAGCSSLTSLNLSSFNTANVTDMWMMFSGCTSLTSLNLSSFNTANVTDMECMFNNCTSLMNLDLSNFNTLSVTNSSSMFDNVPAQCFVYMPADMKESIKNQRSKNLVLKNGSTWTCANCEMTLDTEYDIWHAFTATALTVPGSDASSHVVYVSNAYHSAVRNTNAAIPAGLVKLTLPKTQAVWTAGNGTLTFLYSATPYKAGGTYNGQTVTKVWYGYDITGTPASGSEAETIKNGLTNLSTDSITDEPGA